MPLKVLKYFKFYQFLMGWIAQYQKTIQCYYTQHRSDNGIMVFNSKYEMGWERQCVWVFLASIRAIPLGFTVITTHLFRVCYVCHLNAFRFHRIEFKMKHCLSFQLFRKSCHRHKYKTRCRCVYTSVQNFRYRYCIVSWKVMAYEIRAHLQSKHIVSYLNSIHYYVIETKFRSTLNLIGNFLYTYTHSLLH